MKSLPAFFVVVVLLLSVDALAQEQSTPLPNDGWWIRYSSVKKQNGSGGQIQEFAGQLTYSLVGTVVEDGVTFRWIELNTVFSARGKENVGIWKILVSEKDFLERERPLEALKRGWRQVNKLEVRAVKVGQGTDALETHLMIFPGKWQKADRIDTERVVDYQQGRLTIPQARVLKTTTPVNPSRTKAALNKDFKEVKEYTTWFDSKTAPVFSAAKIQTKIVANDELQATFEEEITIEDTGVDAKSQLPENN